MPEPTTGACSRYLLRFAAGPAVLCQGLRLADCLAGGLILAPAHTMLFSQTTVTLAAEADELVVGKAVNRQAHSTSVQSCRFCKTEVLLFIMQYLN